MQSDFYVYVLFRHDTGAPFYVGKGRGDRWQRHFSNRARDTNRHKRAIIDLATVVGADIPAVKIAIGLTEAQAFETEKALIAVLGRTQTGGVLSNLTDGGEGESGRIFSADHRAKIGAAHKGRALPPEWRAKISAGLRTEETSARISATQKLRFTSEEEKAKAGIANKGRKRSAETAAKQKANNKGHLGHRHSDETRAKMRAARKGRVLSEVTREKLAVAIKSVWARRRNTQSMEIH